MRAFHHGQDRRKNRPCAPNRDRAGSGCAAGSHRRPALTVAAGGRRQGSAGAHAAGGACAVRADRFPGHRGIVAVPGGVAGAGTGPGATRADAGLAVHLLPWRGAADGGGPGDDPDVGTARAALRRCAPEQLRCVRLTGAQAGVRSQRLRRDTARVVRVGRQAARGQSRRGGRDNGFTPQGEPQERCSSAVSGYRTAMRDVRRAVDADCLVRPPRHRRDVAARSSPS